MGLWGGWLISALGCRLTKLGPRMWTGFRFSLFSLTFLGTGATSGMFFLWWMAGAHGMEQKHAAPFKTLAQNWHAYWLCPYSFGQNKSEGQVQHQWGREIYWKVHHSVGKSELSNRIRMGCSRFPKLHPSGFIHSCPMFTRTRVRSFCWENRVKFFCLPNFPFPWPQPSVCL